MGYPTAESGFRPLLRSQLPSPCSRLRSRLRCSSVSAVPIHSDASQSHLQYSCSSSSVCSHWLLSPYSHLDPLNSSVSETASVIPIRWRSCRQLQTLSQSFPMPTSQRESANSSPNSNRNASATGIETTASANCLLSNRFDSSLRWKWTCAFVSRSRTSTNRCHYRSSRRPARGCRSFVSRRSLCVQVGRRPDARPDRQESRWLFLTAVNCARARSSSLTSGW